MNTPPIFYVTKDPERATGTEDLLLNFHIVCPYESTLTETLREQGRAVFTLEQHCKQEQWQETLAAGTYGILKTECVQHYITQEAKGETPCIVVLKTSRLIEELCRDKGWRLWAPKADTAVAFEAKISQYERLRQFVQFPPTYSGELGTIADQLPQDHFPAVLQFNTGHSGQGTVVLQSKEDIAPFKEKFPKREVRISQYIQGNTYTLNALSTKNGNIYTGSISLQITGLSEATNNPLTTVGNDFQKPHDLSSEHANAIEQMARTVGMLMHREGYIGLFGIDVIVDEEQGNIYLIEVNTHQPASISFEATLHRLVGAMPLFLIWIRDMIEQDGYVPPDDMLPPVLLPIPAYQIIYRNKEDKEIVSEQIGYPHTPNVLLSRMKTVKPNEELFRIQVYDEPEHHH